MDWGQQGDLLHTPTPDWKLSLNSDAPFVCLFGYNAIYFLYQLVLNSCYLTVLVLVKVIVQLQTRPKSVNYYSALAVMSPVLTGEKT